MCSAGKLLQKQDTYSPNCSPQSGVGGLILYIFLPAPLVSPTSFQPANLPIGASVSSFLSNRSIATDSPQKGISNSPNKDGARLERTAGRIEEQNAREQLIENHTQSVRWPLNNHSLVVERTADRESTCFGSAFPTKICSKETEESMSIAGRPE